MINLYTAPMTIADIRRLQQQLPPAKSFEDSYAFKAGMMIPGVIPGLVVGAAVGATEYFLSSHPENDYQPAEGALNRDWSGNATNHKYVEAVRAQGRALTNIEVAALERHLTLLKHLKATPQYAGYLAGLAGEVLKAMK